MGTMLPYVVLSSLGPVGILAGAVTAGVAAVAGHAIDNVINKNQQAVIDLAEKYPPSLLAHCSGSEGSIFVPYSLINMFVYYKVKNDVGEAVMYYVNDRTISVEANIHTLEEIVLLLSTPSPEMLAKN